MQNDENPPNPVGRPPFKPTAAQKKDVSLYAAAGMSEASIAAVIGISVPTLRLHFEVELDTGHAVEMAENLKRLRKAADKGNVAAAKHLDAKFGVTGAERGFDTPQHDRPGAEPDTAAPESEASLGKKEQAAAAAKTAGVGTEWGDDLDVGPRAPGSIN